MNKIMEMCPALKLENTGKEHKKQSPSVMNLVNLETKLNYKTANNL